MCGRFEIFVAVCSILYVFIDRVDLRILESSPNKLKKTIHVFEDVYSHFTCAMEKIAEKPHLRKLSYTPGGEVNISESGSPYKAPTDIEVALLANATVLVNWRWEKTPGYDVKNFYIEYVKQTMQKMKKREYICRCRIWYEVTGEMPTDPYAYVVDCLEPNYNYKFRIAVSPDEEQKFYGEWSRWMKLRSDYLPPLNKDMPPPEPGAPTVDPIFGKDIYEEGKKPAQQQRKASVAGMT